jgi:large subunit ribosomal protein L16
MKLNPNKFQFGRTFRVKLLNKHISKHLLNAWFYEYGIKAITKGKIRIQHINAISRLLKRKFKKELKTRYNIALTTPVTQKPDESRMGKGKGQRSHWECNVKRGAVLLEFGGFVNKDKLYHSLGHLTEKLPLVSKINKVIY